MKSVIATGYPVDLDGKFNTTVTIPGSGLGIHMITAVDYTFNFNTTLTVVPTLLLVPYEVPVNTAVESY